MTEFKQIIGRGTRLRIGKPTKIIKLFGGKVAFEQAIRELEYQIYKSA